MNVLAGWHPPRCRLRSGPRRRVLPAGRILGHPCPQIRPGRARTTWPGPASARFLPVSRGRCPSARHHPNRGVYPWAVGARGLSSRVRAAAVPAGRRATFVAAAATAVVLLAGACGGSHLTTERVAPRPPAGSAATPPPDNGQDPAILAAYRGSLSDFNAVATHAPVQPHDAILGNHMTGRQLAFVTSKLTELVSAGQFDMGSLTTIHARVTQFNGTQAVVESCGRDTIQIADAATRQIVKPASPGTELVDSIIQMTDGAWKVSYGSNVSPGCK